MEAPQEVKIMICGGAKVGKTSIFRRLLLDTFDEGILSTIGAGFMSGILNAGNKHLKLYFWDTSGDLRYRSLAQMYSKDMQGIALVFDITQRHTFEDLIGWLSLLDDTTALGVSMILIGNKTDLEL
mmetsp:Transcript_6046/g.10652  ORF Transcript_6046/g.10652 Transcript_6046/m.10652 type:complete len:126 (+) Transcript_6046:124-501(+)